MTYIDEKTGLPEPKSAVRGSWTAIHDNSGNSKKKIKSGNFVSKCHRHPGELKQLSAKAVARKQETAARIARIQKAGVKYRTLLAHPEAKIQYKNDEAYIQPREKGRFLPKISL